jgi:hypothetical protein
MSTDNLRTIIKNMEEMNMLSNKSRLIVTILAVIVLSFTILFGGAAATALAAQSAIPGDTLYSVKTRLEQVRLSLAKDAAARAELQLEYAERRLEESKSLIAEGRFQNLKSATFEFETHIRNALAELSLIAEGDPVLAANLTNRIADTLMRYADTLRVMLDNLPEPVKSEVLLTIRGLDSDFGAIDGLDRGSRTGQRDSSNTNTNDNMNDNTNDNTNDNMNDNTNDNMNDNVNDNINDNMNDNMNDNVNDNMNDNINDNINDNSNDNDNANDNGNDNDD